MMESNPLENMKPTIQTSAVLLVLGGALLPHEVPAAEPQPERPPGRKNILMIAVDDLKPLLGCYGDPVARTPNIDSLAQAGTLFVAAYCQQAVSAATRASLLTGWCPDRTRVWDLKTMIRDMNPEVVTLPQYFVSQGYVSAGVGKIFDARSVDRSNDVRSWSVPYIDSHDFLNGEYETPVLGHYQLPETRRLCLEAGIQAEREGITRRKARDNYIRERVKPSTECAPVPDDAYLDGAIARGAVEFLEHYDGDRPYFLAVGFRRPHLPFCAPEKYWKLYDRDQIPTASFRSRASGTPAFVYHHSSELLSYTDIPASATWSDEDNLLLAEAKSRELIHGYYAAVSYVDAQIGRVVDALRRRGDADCTIIVLWGDHGWHLGDHGLWNKHTNFEQATRVPFLVIDPSAEHSRVEEPVELLDIFPTLCELADVPTPRGLDGKSLAGLIRTERNADPEAYAVSQYPRGNRMGYTLRTAAYRYTVWVDWKDRRSDFDRIVCEELYDYRVDPDEQANLMDRDDYAGVLETMRRHWRGFIAGRGGINRK